MGEKEMKEMIKAQLAKNEEYFRNVKRVEGTLTYEEGIKVGTTSAYIEQNNFLKELLSVNSGNEPIPMSLPPRRKRKRGYVKKADYWKNISAIRRKKKPGEGS